ncbi:MAG TPA: cupin domain-containing protein [Gaiellaceae bacterium]|nr:cupin domain-containing protein [Gaiellaceae bacterium]
MAVKAEKTAEAGDSALGARLREERDRVGLSLRELARRLEVSPSLVSQIETGKTQPSVRTLYAIVNELGVSLDDVFSRENGGVRTSRGRGKKRPGGDAVQRAHDRSVIDLGSGVHWERLTTWNDRDVDFLYAIYEPGGASSPDESLVRHNGREFGIVVSGKLGVTVGFDEYVLEPGDSISFDSSVPHRLHNDGAEVVNAIWVVLGRHHPPEQ